MIKNGERATGKFSLPDGRNVFGALEVCGPNSKVELFDDQEFSYANDSFYNYITGELSDGRLVTLLDGILLKSGGQMGPSDSSKHFAELFPHYVTVGSAYVPQLEPCVTTISFVMEDAKAIYYDFDAFSTVLDAKPFIPLLKKDKASIRDIEFGDHPIIAYFTGKFEIAKVETILGTVYAEHRPSFTSGGPDGVEMNNRITVSLVVSTPIEFQKMIDRLCVLLRFYELALGREQPLSQLTVLLNGQPQDALPIDVYRSLEVKHSDEDSDSLNRPHPSSVLVSTLHDSEQYSTVLRNYLESDKERRDSRTRMHKYFQNGRIYTIERLIAAANVFDIFPDSAYPGEVSLSTEMANAKEQARQLFRSLPDSYERNSVLGALGRIGKLSLKHKIRHRVESTELNQYFPKLVDVLNEAVNCRNHYVHGTQGRFDYSSNFDIVCFFTDALEFVFAVSDLIDNGWNFPSWKSRRPSYSHPFGNFVDNYKRRLEGFEELFAVFREKC